MHCSFKAKVSVPHESCSTRKKNPSFDHEATATLLRNHPQLFASMDSLPWQLNVHCHAAQLATATMNHLSPWIHRVPRTPRKRHLGALTWSVLTWKRQLRKQHLTICRRLKFGPLREILLAWHGQRRGVPPVKGTFQHWMKMMHFKKALLEHTMTRVQPLLQQVLKEEDAHYYGTLFEIEQTCRKTTLGRAAGLDMILPEICRNGASSISRHIHNLIMKITCNQMQSPSGIKVD